MSVKCGVFIEAESPDSAKAEEERQTRERRIRFYLSNGAERTNAKRLLFVVDYDITFISGKETNNPTEQLTCVVQALYREIYGAAYGRLCKLYEAPEQNE